MAMTKNSPDNMVIQNVEKDAMGLDLSLSLVSTKENDILSRPLLANKRNQEEMGIKNSAIFTLSYGPAQFVSNTSQLIKEFRERESPLENEMSKVRHVEDCALQYVLNISRNLEQTGASNSLDSDLHVNISGNEIVLAIDNSKFILDNGLDDYDVLTHNCDQVADLSTVTPKFKLGSPKANVTPCMNIMTPCIEKRPLKNLSNMPTLVYTPDANNNSTDKKSVDHETNSWFQKSTKLQRRKRLNFSECKENKGVDLKDFDEKNCGGIKSQNIYKRSLKQLNYENNSPSNLISKFSQANHFAKCYVKKIGGKENCTSSDYYNSTKTDKHHEGSRKLKKLMEKSRLTSKMRLRSFVRRSFYNRSDLFETPTSGFNSIENCLLSPQSLMGKRLVFSKPATVFKKTDAKVIISDGKKYFTLNCEIPNKVEKRIPRELDSTANESTSHLFTEEYLLQESNQKSKTCNMSLLSLPICSESPPPLKKCRVMLTQSLVTPHPYMPVPSLDAPRKKRYSCRRSSPYCRRKLIKDFERLQIETEAIYTPPCSPHVG